MNETASICSVPSGKGKLSEKRVSLRTPKQQQYRDELAATLNKWRNTSGEVVGREIAKKHLEEEQRKSIYIV